MELQLEYRGFYGSATFNIASGKHEGFLLGVADRVFYQATTLESLVANFEAAVDEYIEFMDEILQHLGGESLVEDQHVDVIIHNQA